MSPLQKAVLILGLLLPACASNNLVLGGPPAVVTDFILPGASAQKAGFLPEVPPLPKTHDVAVRLDVTHQVQEVAEGVRMTAWAYGGSVPGPTLHVRQGDTIHFTMANRSDETAKLTAPMPHSMDFHAAMVSSDDKYRSVAPGQSIQYQFTANYPGAFMYHCATPLIMHHIAMGMFGMLIVEPRAGYPTKADREYVVIESEFYPDEKAKPEANGGLPIDLQALGAGQPAIYAFNGEAMKLEHTPLKARAGERVRLYVLNAGPNTFSSFHIVGTVLDRVYLSGNPENQERGVQTVEIPPGSSAIVEFIVPESGRYVIMDHALNHAALGAMGYIDATQ